MGEKRCATCRYWDAHSIAARKGDCRAPGDHRYSRAPIGTGCALLDSFGPEETAPTYVCGAWSFGQADGTLDLRRGRP